MHSVLEIIWAVEEKRDAVILQADLNMLLCAVAATKNHPPLVTVRTKRKKLSPSQDAIHAQESVDLVEYSRSLEMTVNVMASFRHEKLLRSCTCRGEKGRFDGGRLIRREGAVASAKRKIVLAQDNVDRTSELFRRL